jgi:hypothetical protein
VKEASVAAGIQITGASPGFVPECKHRSCLLPCQRIRRILVWDAERNMLFTGVNFRIVRESGVITPGFVTSLEIARP